MRVNLNIRDRIILGSILPVKGNFVTMEMVTQLRSKLLLSASEITEAGVRENNNQGFVWDATKDPMKEFKLYDSELTVIRKALTDLDAESNLTADHMPLYKIFVSLENIPVDFHLRTSGIANTIHAVPEHQLPLKFQTGVQEDAKAN